MSRNVTKLRKPDYSDALNKESEKINAKIDAGIEKLANKFQRKAEKAKAAMDSQKPEKRVTKQRRFELYAAAAARLNDRPDAEGDLPDIVDD